MKKIGDFIIEKRILFLSVIVVLTLFFMYRMTRLEVYTKYSDLLPQGHEYIKVHNDIRSKFGGANTVTMLLQVREGDIFIQLPFRRYTISRKNSFLFPG